MFKFLKEIKDSIKEGIAEAKDEMAEEAREAVEAKTVQAGGREKSPLEEFGVSLGAPYREIYVRTMGAHNDPQKVFTLRELELPEDSKSDYASVLDRDFGVKDAESLRMMTSTIWSELTGEPPEFLEAVEDLEDEVDLATGYAVIFRELTKAGKDALKCGKQTIDTVQDMEDRYSLGERGGDAFRLAVLSHIIAGGCALQYIDREEALVLLEPVVQHALDVYGGWEDYSAGFLAGESAWGGNTMMGRKVVVKTTDKLLSHERSPWVTLPFALEKHALH